LLLTVKIALRNPNSNKSIHSNPPVEIKSSFPGFVIDLKFRLFLPNCFVSKEILAEKIKSEILKAQAGSFFLIFSCRNLGWTAISSKISFCPDNF